MDNKRAAKLTASLRRGNTLENGIGAQYWYESVPGGVKRDVVRR